MVYVSSILPGRVMTIAQRRIPRRNINSRQESLLQIGRDNVADQEIHSS